MGAPWDDPDWYDLHDTTWTAGPEREPEHYRELVIALPPLGPDDHVVDVGTGTGKLARLIAASYPSIGRVTLIEPNRPKLERARKRLGEALPDGRIGTLQGGIGDDAAPAISMPATLVTVGSVVMPTLMLAGGTLADGLAWTRRALGQCLGMLAPGKPLFLLETLAPPWAAAEAGSGCRRLFLPELVRELEGVGFEDVECVYRFRDRVAVRAARP
ncbi:MAG: hypothetical protein IPK07_11540 [Deltaproteobacteria bacterium]|nr:hypothetical protein [Deltaproteobacteria bacterium]